MDRNQLFGRFPVEDIDYDSQFKIDYLEIVNHHLVVARSFVSNAFTDSPLIHQLLHISSNLASTPATFHSSYKTANEDNRDRLTSIQRNAPYQFTESRISAEGIKTRVDL